MNVILDFFQSLTYAVKLVIKGKLYYYFIPSILIAFVFYLIASGGSSYGKLFEFMEDWWLIGWFIEQSKSLFSFIGFVLLEFIILVLLSPINSYFAEKTREDLTGSKINFSISVFLRSLKRMIIILCFALIIQLLLTITIWILSFAVGDQFYEIASLINISFFIGFSFFDFGLELNEVNRRDSWKYAKKNWLICILIGLVFNIGIYYPQEHGYLLLYVLSIILLPHLLGTQNSTI